MKKYILHGLMCAALLGGQSLQAAQAATTSSLAERVEQLGEMKYLKVVNGKMVKRNGLLAVQLEVKNSQNSNQQLYYRFRWLDDAGFVVGGEEAWKPLKFIGLQKQIIDTVAPVQSAVDFRLEVNSPENSGAK